MPRDNRDWMRQEKSTEITRSSCALWECDYYEPIGNMVMKLVHCVSIAPDESQRQCLNSLGIELIESGSPLVRSATFTIREDDPSWPEVRALIHEWKLLDFAGTEFS